MEGVQSTWSAEPPASEAGSGPRVIVLPGSLRLVLLVANFAVQAVPLWLMYSTGQGWPVLIIAGVLLGLVPALDHLLAGREYRFDGGISDIGFRRLLLLQAGFLFLTFLGVVIVAASGRVPLWASLAAVFTIGIINVHVAIVAHEFGHKMDARSRFYSNAICAIAGLGYFMPQHVMGHHVKVATPEDCASAQFGQTSFGFIIKSFVPEIRGGITLEAERLRKRGLPFWSRHNDVLVSYGISLIVAATLVGVLGWAALPWILLHHATVWFSLMLNDYIQHYALLREMQPNGRREPQGPAHSWSAESPLCDLMTFNVPRHSHHHARPMAHYHELTYLEDGPKCPTGYFGMMAIALNPLWWRHTMDPLVVKVTQGRRERINVAPGAEKRLEKLIAQYHASA
jgi:alkane 1-monooxygenase